MTTSVAALWLRAMNPLHCPRAMAEAQRSARTVVIGLGISLILSIGQTAWLASTPAFETMLNAQYASMGLTPTEIAVQQANMQTLWPYAIGLAVLMSAALYGVVALIQWRRMGRAIPLILLAFIFYGVFVGGGLRLTGAAVDDLGMPLWLQLTGLVVTAVSAVIYTAALQGAILLHRLKGQP